MKNFDGIVVGAGIWGSTLARRLAETGRKVLVFEKRAVVGGNCRCEIVTETGIEKHTYGSHIFHAKNEKTWESGDEPYYPINNPESAALLPNIKKKFVVCPPPSLLFAPPRCWRTLGRLQVLRHGSGDGRCVGDSVMVKMVLDLLFSFV